VIRGARRLTIQIQHRHDPIGSHAVNESSHKVDSTTFCARPEFWPDTCHWLVPSVLAWLRFPTGRIGLEERVTSRVCGMPRRCIPARGRTHRRVRAIGSRQERTAPLSTRRCMYACTRATCECIKLGVQGSPPFHTVSPPHICTLLTKTFGRCTAPTNHTISSRAKVKREPPRCEPKKKKEKEKFIEPPLRPVGGQFGGGGVGSCGERRVRLRNTAGSDVSVFSFSVNRVLHYFAKGNSGFSSLPFDRRVQVSAYVDYLHSLPAGL